MNDFVDEIVEGSLYQGAFPAMKHLDFVPDLHIHTAAKIPKTGPDALENIRLHLYDDPAWDWRKEPRQVKRILKAVQRALAVLRRGGRVLVTCQAGINRSGLVTATILIYGFGMTPREAVSLIREKRPSEPQAVSNRSFQSFLLALPAPKHQDRLRENWRLLAWK